MFPSIPGRLSKRGRKRREVTDESKNVQTTPTRTHCKCSRPLLTVGQGPTALAVGAGGGLFGHFYSHLQSNFGSSNVSFSNSSESSKTAVGPEFSVIYFMHF